jgi:hypothetical protein
MSCCDKCDCLATLRVRQLVGAEHAFDVLLDQQSFVDEYREHWYAGADDYFRGYSCFWRGEALIDEATRFELRAWHGGSQPLITLAPLNADDRPLCLHVFSSFSDPHSDHRPPAHEWEIDVTDAGDDRLDIAFKGQHLGYPIPCTSPDQNGTEDGSGRLAKFELLQYASPGSPQIYRLTKGRDEYGNVLSFKLAPWGNEAPPFTFAADDTPEDIEDELHENAHLPPIAHECVRGGLDLFGYARTLGDASLGPQLNWSTITLWLTFHEVRSPPTRIPESAVHSWPHHETDPESLFHNRARIYVWPHNDLDWRFRNYADDYPHMQPPWVTFSLEGGGFSVADEVTDVWIEHPDPYDPPTLPAQMMQLQPKIVVTQDAVTLRLLHRGRFHDEDAHGDAWYEYRSTEPPDLIDPKEYTLEFAGFFVESPGPDNEMPAMLPLDWQQANALWASNTIGTPLHRPVNQDGESLNLHTVTWRVLITDFGRIPNPSSEATAQTGITVIADGWDGGHTSEGEVADLNGEHVMWGDADTALVSDNPGWFAIAIEAEPGGSTEVGYELIYFAEAVPDQHSGWPNFEPYRLHSPWNYARQLLVAHIDDEHVYFRPKTRAIASDDPDEVVFVRDPAPPDITWRDSPATIDVTSIPDEITVRVGPAKVSSHCPVCVENQQVTPMAWEATFGDEELLLLRRADCVWAAHLDGLQPYWIPEGHESLPDPLHHRLFALEGLETLRLYEVPANGGQRRPIAVYRFRPIEYPGPPRVPDDEATEDVYEGFLGWQDAMLDCESERRLTLWQLGQGYDPAIHLLPSHIDLKPIGNNCVAGSITAEWKHPVNRWEPLDAELLPDDFGLPVVPGTYPLRDKRTLCVDFNDQDAGIIWIDDEERWRVFAIGCGFGQLPSVPASPDDGEPDEVRRIRCYTPDPPEPPDPPCRWISNDGTTWEPVETNCPEGHECRPPFRAPAFAGDVAAGYCEPVSCLGGESTWVWLDATHDWHLQDHTCPDWCDPRKPGYVGHDTEVGTGDCWCLTCT